ncbi:MAG: alpha-2-macroglobulin family protein, partial [Anaerolineae bacterium]
RVDIVSTKPLLVRPVVPRFFVVGDEARLGMIVQNNTQDSLEVETRFEAQGLTIKPLDAATLTVKAGARTKVEYDVTVGDVITAQLTMGAKSIGHSPQLGDAVALNLPVYRFSTPETVATAGELAEDGTRTEGIVLPGHIDLTQGNLTVDIDPSLAAGMRNGLKYLEDFPYECIEQTVSDGHRKRGALFGRQPACSQGRHQLSESQSAGFHPLCVGRSWLGRHGPPCYLV